MRGIFWSSSKKNSASARRARMTFSLPRATTAGSFATVLLIVTKWGMRRPDASTTGKYFWCEIIVVVRTSFGSFR